MPGFELGEKIANRARLLPGSGMLQPLTYAFARICLRCDVKKSLICFRVLNDCRSPAFDGENEWTLGLLELLDEIARAATEGSKGLDIRSEVKHRHVFI